MFAYFAQWFTDGFLRSDRRVERDPRRNDSTHEIDLLPLYGVRPAWTEQLRAHEGGRLKSQTHRRRRVPALPVRGRRRPSPSSARSRSCGPDQIPPERRDDAVRRRQRHDELADRLRDAQRAVPARAQPDRRAARARVPGVGRRAPVPDRAQHPDRAPDQARDRGVHQPHRAVPLQARRRPGAVQERALVPHELDGDRVQPALPLARPDPVARCTSAGADEPIWQHGLQPGAGRRARPRAAVRATPRSQRAGRIGLLNTDAALREVELRQHPRGAAPSSSRRYNDYRELAGFPRVTDFDQISGDPEIQAGLRDLYGHVDRIEFYPGLFAEDARPELRAAVADRPDGRRRRVLAGADQPAAGAARVQRGRRSRRSAWRSSARRARSRTSCTATSRRARGATSSR